MRALRWVAIVAAIAGLLGIVNSQPRNGQDWLSLTLPTPSTGRPTLPAEPVAAQLDGGSVAAARGVAGVSGDDGGEGEDHGDDGASGDRGDRGGHGDGGEREDRPDRTADPTPSTAPTRTPTGSPSTSPTTTSPTDASSTTTTRTTPTTTTPTPTTSGPTPTDPTPTGPTPTGPNPTGPNPTGPTPTDPTPTPTDSTPTPTPTDSTPTRSALFGASGPDRLQVESLETGLGRQMGGIRVYRRWGEPLIDDTSQWAADGGRALFVSVRAMHRDGRLVPWADIAAAAPGSDLYADMARLGQQAAAFPGPINLTFNHEPEADPQNGTAADFVAAWRNWVQAVRDQGALNVTFVWTVTGYGFVRTDDRAASLYWPGDFWADAIGVDAYNAADCITPNGRWREPAEVFGPALGFAAEHPSHPLVLMEWSSVEDPADPGRKAAWIRSLGDWADSSPQVAGLLQWGARGALPEGTPGCDYAMTSSGAAAQAWRDLGGRSWLQASGGLSAP